MAIVDYLDIMAQTSEGKIYAVVEVMKLFLKEEVIG